MTTKYFYKGKLLRTSHSSKLSYEYAIYNAETGTAKSLSKDYESLASQLAERIAHYTECVGFLSKEVETGLDGHGRPLTERGLRTREIELEGATNCLKWWSGAEIVSVEKEVID